MSGKIELYTPKYFAYCGVGGILSCGITHTAVTPLDLVKCNVQGNPKEFTSTMAGFRAIYSGRVTNMGHGSGLRGLVKGWGPTAWGYSLQGLCKFGFYEVFKHYYGQMLSSEEARHKWRSVIYMFASASAELIADVALCPFEAVKVRVQTSPSFARGVLDGMPKMIREGGVGSLYAGLVPLWARQVPYTIIKFVAFERIAEWVYSLMPKKKEDMNKAEQMGVVFTSGYLAGVLCGAVSHPADTMVSKIYKVQGTGSLMDKMRLVYSGDGKVPGIGFRGLWAGFAPRVVMIGTLTGLQWFIYGAFKTSVGLPAPGGK